MQEHDYKAYPELTNTELETERFNSPHPQITQDFEATVIKVHDGDTITLKTSFRDFNFPLRLANIDAPELNEGGEETREWLKEKLLNRNITILINQKNRVGKYGRLIGTVLSNGMNIGDEMLRLGLVVQFGKKKESLPPSLAKTFSLKRYIGA